MRTERERLLDALEAIERIEKYAVHGRHRFEQDELIQTWVIHHLEILGEALARVSAATQQENPKVPWREITGMRNVPVHGYFGVETDIVWKVVSDHPIMSKNVAGGQEARVSSMKAQLELWQTSVMRAVSTARTIASACKSCQKFTKNGNSFAEPIRLRGNHGKRNETRRIQNQNVAEVE